MVYLQRDNFQMALELLKRAEMLAERSEASKGVTFNNFACYYRRVGKVKIALSYLTRALEIEARL
jgi:tetratricopeptide (TPR) repeat protein